MKSFRAALVVSALASICLAQSTSSTTTLPNGKEINSSTSVQKNADGTRTRTSDVTGPNGQTAERKATRGNGEATVERASGATRTTTHSK